MRRLEKLKQIEKANILAEQRFIKSKSINEGELEKKVRLSDKIIAILNKQIENELYSSQMYRTMSAWLDDEGWNGGSALFFKYADEELVHMSKIYQYLYAKNCRAIVPTVENVPKTFKDVRALLEAALEHEIKVTKNWNDIANKSKSEDDNDTYSFAITYVNEQREEEEKIRTLIENMNLDMPKWKIDEMFQNLI